MAEKTPVIIDCDPGHDDMVALVLALGSEALDVKAITNVAGNKTMEKVTRNTLNILNWCGVETEVAAGAERPLVRPYTRTDDEGCHGLTGLDGFDFPAENPLRLSARRAIEMMADVVRSSPVPVTLITTGPTTNVGLFLRAFPDLAKKIERISMMAGTCHFVLTKPFMEFNAFLDAEATRIIFESGVPITMYGYDVTYSVLFRQEFTQRLLKTGTRTGRMMQQLLDEFTVLHNNRWIDLGGCPVHDALAVAGVIDPSLIKQSEEMYVEIQTEPGPLSGATICDYQHRSGKEPNARVVFALDDERFFNMVVAAAARLK